MFNFTELNNHTTTAIMPDYSKYDWFLFFGLAGYFLLCFVIYKCCGNLVTCFEQCCKKDENFIPEPNNRVLAEFSMSAASASEEIKPALPVIYKHSNTQLVVEAEIHQV